MDYFAWRPPQLTSVCRWRAPPRAAAAFASKALPDYMQRRVDLWDELVATRAANADAPPGPSVRSILGGEVGKALAAAVTTGDGRTVVELDRPLTAGIVGEQSSCVVRSAR